MKRPWKTSSLILLAFVMILPLSGCNFGTSPIPEPPPKLSIPLNKLNVDWDKAVADAIEAVDSAASEDGSLIFSPHDISITVSDKSMICNVDVGSYPGKSITYRTMGYLLRALNTAAKEQDDRIPESDAFTYGGLYDVADLQVKVVSEQGVYMDDALSPGEHRQRGLRISSDMLSVDWYACVNRFEELYPSEYDPIVTGAAIAPYAYEDDKVPIITLLLGVRPGTSQQKAKESALKAMETFNQLCQRFDPSISDFSSAKYGGIYDHAFFLIAAVELDAFGDISSVDYNKDTLYCMWLEPGEYEKLDDNTGYDKELNKLAVDKIAEYFHS